MSFSKLLANVRRYDSNATVIFDREEPIGRATDLVMPCRPWFRWRKRTRISQPSASRGAMIVGRALTPAEAKRRQAGALALEPQPTSRAAEVRP